ncbi:MAG: HAD-IIB family hydrolase [Patescibacteria group bacterium]
MKKYSTIITDADGTLAHTREPIDRDMAELISKFLYKGVHFVVISGATLDRLIERIVHKLPPDTPLENLYLLPASGSLMYSYQNGAWQEVYAYTLEESDKAQIISAFQQVLDKNDMQIPHVSDCWGTQLEDRGASFAFSALGQDAPREEKSKWDQDESKRRALIRALEPLLSEYDLLIGGTTTIDINKKEHGKDFGVREFLAHTNTSINEIFFIGDQLNPGGNDYPVTTLGIESYHTQGPNDTFEKLQSLLEQV